MMRSRSAVVVIFALFAIVAGKERDDDATGIKSDADKITYDGAQLLRVQNVGDKLKAKIGELEEAKVLKTWAATKSSYDFMVTSDKLTEVKAFLSSENTTFQVIIDNVQRAIEVENPDYDTVFLNHRERPKSEWRRDIWVKPMYIYYKVKLRKNKRNSYYYKVANNKAYRLSWLRYHRFDDYVEYMGYLQNHFSNLVSIIDIGTSVEGRPIKVIKISSGTPNAKAIWIDGGTHAREWITSATVSYIVNQLVENRAAHESAVAGLDFYIAPLLNPDGYEYTHTVDRLWRKNRNKRNGFCAGTDLNRNWGYKWGGAGSSKQPCKEIYAGSGAFSEPETKAVSNFVLSKKDSIKAYITFHSYGQYILYPWGYGTKVPPDYADLDRVGRKIAAAIRGAGGPTYTVGNSASTLYPASGGADDWAKGVAGIKYTYTIELRDNGVYGFVLPAQFIEPSGKESLAAIKAVAEEVKIL